MDQWLRAPASCQGLISLWALHWTRLSRVQRNDGHTCMQKYKCLHNGDCTGLSDGEITAPYELNMLTVYG